MMSQTINIETGEIRNGMCDDVSPATLKNCWNHTEIQRPPLPKIMLRHHLPSMPANLAAGWDIIIQYATEQWSLPDIHTCLQEHLGGQYVASNKNESLDSVLRALMLPLLLFMRYARNGPRTLPPSCVKWPQHPMSTRRSRKRS